MAFGKHRGQPLEELPDSYIDWLAALADLRQPLRDAVAAEQARRTGDHAGHATAPAMPSHLAAAALEIVRAGLHALALRHHPDRGGGLVAMQEVSSAATALRRLLGGRS